MNSTLRCPDRPSGSIPLLQWVWRAYLRASLVPLLMVELVIIAIYLLANYSATVQNQEAVRALAEEELQRIAQRESVVIQKQLKAISGAVDLFRRQAARSLQTPYQVEAEERARYAYGPQGVYYTTQDTGGAALYYSGITPVGPEQRDKAFRTARLDPLMADIQQTYPLVVQVYLNTYDSLTRIYPYFDVLDRFPPRLELPSFNFYYEADAAHNPERRVVWTGVYVDPAGQGWMTSAIAPVYEGDFLEGVVGLDVTVAAIIDRILNLPIPWQGYGVLIGKDGTLLALPEAGEEDWGIRELTNYSYTGMVSQNTFKPEAFNLFGRTDLDDFAVRLREQPDGAEPIELNGRKMVAWSTIPETGWKLLVLVPEANIYAQTTELGQQLFEIGTWMIIGLVVFYAVFLLVLYRRARVMAHSISAPLQAVDNLVQRIGGGDYEQEAPAFPVTELQNTATSLVAMGHQLGASSRRLRYAQREAEQARDAALKSSRLKSEFLASVSHEIRTPMSGILGMIDLLLDTPLASEQREFALAVQDSGQSLLRIINDILDFSKIESGRIELADSAFRPLDVVEGAAEVLAPRASERRLELMTFIEPTVPALVAGDAGRLRQILLNLIGNGVKFTERGEVTVRVSLDEATDSYAMLYFSVSDTGIGISTDAHERLFQPFTQVDGSLVRPYGGTGLGLSICKRLVDLMGGEIGVDSQGGAGSTFWFKLPFRLVQGSVPLAEQYPCRDDLRILVLEHGARSREILRDHLLSWKIHTVIAANACEVLAAQRAARAKNLSFDLLLLALNLEECQDALLNILVENPALAGIPRILLANFEEKGLDTKARELGFAAYLTKPLRQSRLLNCLAAVSSSSQQAVGVCTLASNSSSAGTDAALLHAVDKPVRVLLAEDNPVNQKVALSRLRKLGYSVDVAENGKVAVERALAHHYELILMDIQMPVMDGIEATWTIRAAQAERNEHSTIVAVTANAMEGERERFLAEGMDDYLSKPYQMDQLERLLQRWLESAPSLA